MKKIEWERLKQLTSIINSYITNIYRYINYLKKILVESNFKWKLSSERERERVSKSLEYIKILPKKTEMDNINKTKQKCYVGETLFFFFFFWSVRQTFHKYRSSFCWICVKRERRGLKCERNLIIIIAKKGLNK